MVEESDTAPSLSAINWFCFGVGRRERDSRYRKGTLVVAAVVTVTKLGVTAATT